MATTAEPSALVRRLAEASRTVVAVTRFLEDIASFLRQLVHIAGWAVLLVSLAALLLHPEVSLGHLAVPGAGTLAILQSLIRPKSRHGERAD